MFRSPLLVLVLAGALLALAGQPVADAAAGGPADRKEHGKDRPEDRETPDAKGSRGRGSPTSIGGFALALPTRAIEGDYLSFVYDATSVQNFTVGGVPLFDIQIGRGPGPEGAEGAPRGNGTAIAKGAEVRLRTPAFSLHAHDTPGAVTKVTTDGAMTLVFREGVDLVGDGRDLVAFGVGNLSGRVKGESLRLNGSAVTVEDRALIFMDTPRGAFDVHRSEIGRAIGRGHVGIEASFDRAPDRDEVEESVVAYGNVTLTTLRAERGNLTLLVEGHGPEGRVLVLNVDGRVLGAARAADLDVRYDDAPLREATSLVDVLDPDDDGLHAEYYVVFDPALSAFQLLVSIPHYSVHTLSITTIVPLPPPSVVVGIVAGLLLLVPGGYALFRRR